MEPFYFGPNNRLFGARSEPLTTPRETAVLMCYSWGTEYMRSYRALHLLAHQLAVRGFETLRFDYSGTGDSADPEDGLSLERWVEDIRCAVQELRELSGVERVCLLGLRLGGLLALRALHEGVRAEGVVLWDLPASGQQWIEQLQALDRLHYARKNRYLPTALQLQSLPDELLGSPWPQRLNAAVAALQPQPMPAACEVLQLQSSDTPTEAQIGRSVTLPDPAHWTDVSWLTRPWTPANTPRVICETLAERLT